MYVLSKINLKLIINIYIYKEKKKKREKYKLKKCYKKGIPYGILIIIFGNVFNQWTF